MKFKFFYSLAIFFSSSIIFSQEITVMSGRNYYLSYASMNKASELNKPYYESITGSPFLNDTYLPVRLNNYQTVVLARYDAYKDIFEIKNAKKNLSFHKKHWQ